MSSTRFRGIRVGLVSVFSCLLLLLGLFTFTGTASAQTVQTNPLFVSCLHGQVRVSAGYAKRGRYHTSCVDPASLPIPLRCVVHGQVLMSQGYAKRGRYHYWCA